MKRGSIITTPTARVAVGFVTKQASQPVPWNPLSNMLGLSHAWSCLTSREVGDLHQIEGTPNATDYLLRAIAKGVIHSLGGFQLRGWLSHFPARQCSCGHGEDHAGTGFGATLNPLYECHWTHTGSPEVQIELVLYCSQDSSITRRLCLPYATMPAWIAAIFGRKREVDNILRLL